ncbi:aminopeptidase N [Aminobacter carboxidus]|uniref:Aminopeptidase N n=1 Tax=Aminobacter carboxidus TaxID=376165 RepID=A0A8E1WF48_9HYPH|nr:MULTISPECIES: aminopeptidase N [Aminobacter carboxidus group]MBB6466873.1 aminopeptidase N [Aminobacter lissarensis]MBE1203083.1 aminopeptidase N [Aminobacter carboxidus]
MRTDTGQVFRLEDYRPSDYLIPRTELDFRLGEDSTKVVARLTIERRAGVDKPVQLELDGDGLTMRRIEVDGEALDAADFDATPDRLVIHTPPASGRFTLLIETELAPSRNEALMGLYRSSNVYCTQCEAEGFRRITYFLDRPDVLSVYTVRMEALRTEAPLLLSNGNPVEHGDLEDGWHYAVWHDPFPKPSYLFALVAGDLGCIKDRFVTASGKEVELGIYVEHGKENQAGYAMDSLRRSMKWDEEVFGCEYDLDVFNIVAVSDFNMGAMENKGLNIFNDKYVLADEETATDADFANIEAIIAHEYFHNWTGNRITCRDWFQLCLKEGLTVFRDHEFSADQRSRPVKRIAEVRTLRAHQFPEDQGPLAHPVRPRRYREINNFYTPTVYEKGSEVVRMIRTILGAETFRRGMDLYLERHDGDAATIEDFVKVFEEVSDRDLSQFALWYHQAGTPNLSVTTRHSPATAEFIIEVEQSVPPTPSESRKRLMHIPLAFGLVGADGKDMGFEGAEGATVEDGVIHVRKRKHVVTFSGVTERPVLSLNRGFSAPITLSIEQRPEDQIFLASHDSDAFSRWQAFNTLLTDAIIAAFRNILGGKQPAFGTDLTRLTGRIAVDATLEHAFRALALALPGEADVAREIGKNIDPDAIFAGREALARSIAEANGGVFAQLYDDLLMSGPFSPDAASAGRRALRNTLLDYLAMLPDGAQRAAAHFASATNMTDRAAALAVLAHRHAGSEEAKAALAEFDKRYRSDPLVMDKWFMIQATAPGTGAVDAVRALTEHPAFSIANPNRVRSLIGGFASANQTGFHRADGAGYTFFTETVLTVEKRNPQVAARLATALRSWRSLEPKRQAKARDALLTMQAKEGLSADLRDIIERTLA